VKSEKTHLWRPICLPLNYGTHRSEKRNAKYEMRCREAGRRSWGYENVGAFTFDSCRGCFNLCFFFD